MSENVAIEASETRSVTAALALILALACGFIAANLYYAQPLTGLIGAALGLGPAQIGLLVTMTQIGYGLGLILFVPLGDLIENRTLAVGGVAFAMAALVVMALAQSAGVFLSATRSPVSPARPCKSCCRSQHISPLTPIAAASSAASPAD
jgi:MFS family permease